MTNYNNTIKDKILSYYRNNKRDLPWRTKEDNNQNPYYTLVSEIMLQQTQVSTALDYYKRFIKKWPTVNSLASANIDEVLVLWAGLGYYSRAKNLLKTAQIIKNNFHGLVPNKYDDLISLPGIGDYTASAILSFAYGKPTLALDTNIKRFITRIFGIDSLEKKEISKYGTYFFANRNSGKITQAVMDFSSQLCTKKKPACLSCFLKSYCKYDEYKEKPKKTSFIKKKYSIVIFYIYKNKYFFLRKRSLNKILGGMYEVPGTEWSSKSWPSTPTSINGTKVLCGILTYKFSHINLKTKVFKLNIKSKKLIKEKGIWINLLDLKDYPISGLTKKIIKFSINK